MKLLRDRLLYATAVAVAVAPSAFAQAVDYGQSELLFGEPVTTSATGSPQKASDAPANMQIITADDIRRSGAATIPDILKFVSGIDVRTSASQSQTVSIRGSSQGFNPRLLVLINGRQVYLDDYGYTAWQALPVQLDEIRQIEVVKGPASALFGFNAASGVINIITYDPLFDSTNAATLRGGTQPQLGGDAVATIHPTDNTGLRLSVGGNQGREFNTSSLPALQGPYDVTPYTSSFGLDGRYKPTANTELTAEFTSSNSRNIGPLGQGDSIDTLGYRTTSFKLGGAADTDLGLLNIDAYRNEANNSYQEGQILAVSDQNVIYVVQASDLFKVGTENTIRVGLEYRSNSLQGDFLAQSIGYDDYAGSVMWNWKMTSQLSLTNAVRLDYLALNRTGSFDPASPPGYTNTLYNNTTIIQPSFNSGLVYEPTDLDTIRLLLARGIQAPSLIEFGAQYRANLGAPLPILYGGAPNLNASTTNNVEIDYDRSIPEIESTLRTAIYYQNTQAILSSGFSLPFGFSDYTLYSQSQNIGHSHSYGGEIGVQGSDPSGLRWNLSYSLVSTKDYLTVGALAPTPWDFAHATPTSMVDFGIGYTWDKLEADIQGKWQSSYVDYNDILLVYTPVKISDFVTVNARVGYNFNEHVTLALTGQQLANSTIQEASGIPIERRAIASLTLRF